MPYVCVLLWGRSYYKCIHCQPKDFELGPELAKKVPEPIQGFPPMFLVRYYGEHSSAPHSQRPVAERILWENSCPAQGGAWADLRGPGAGISGCGCSSG